LGTVGLSGNTGATATNADQSVNNTLGALGILSANLSLGGGSSVALGSAGGGGGSGGGSGGGNSIGGTPINPTYVASLYQGLLGRTAEDYGLGYWTALLDAGTARTTVASGVMASAEAQARQVEGLYETLLGRTADPLGLAYWTSLLQAGQSIDQVKVDLLASPEFYARSGGTIDGFLQNLYREELNRDPDSLGEDVFRQRADGRRIARGCCRPGSWLPGGAYR
jgi:hypothetical protein